jgi:hypothetical protein
MSGRRAFAGMLAVCAVLLVAAGLQALYWWGGHRFVAEQYAHPSGPFLFNLISAPGPHALDEYLARADAVWTTFQIAWVLVALTLIAEPALAGPTARLHDATLRFGQACADHRRTFLIVGAAAVAVSCALIGWLALLHFPNSGDEYCYLYQAQTFLAGRFGNTPHPLQQFFPTSHVIVRNGHLFSVFPPGLPLIMAIAAQIGLPAWALNPLMSGGLFVLTFELTRRITGSDTTGALASLTLVSSSYFLVTGASFFSHTACAFLVVATMVAMVRMTEGSAVAAALAGLAASLAVITRYYTPILCLLPITIVLWREHPWRRVYLWAIVGALPALGFILAYNHALTGNALLLSKAGVENYDELWFAPGTWHRGAELIAAHLSDLMLWTPPVLLIAYFAGLRRTPLASRLGAVSAGFACLVLGLYPYINRGGNQYGPRFYFDGLPLLVIGAAAALFGPTPFAERSRGARRIVYLFFASMIAHVPIAASQIRSVHAEIVERLDLARQVESARLQHALVFVQTPIDTMPMTDYIRNGIDFDQPVLFAADLGDQNHELEAFYPDRACYTYRFELATRTGSLRPCGPR